MKKRLCWSMLFSSALIVSAAVALAPAADAASIASSSGAGAPGVRLPITTKELAPRIPNAGKQFDGFSSTDYFGVSRDFTNPANPDIAVGPDDILIVAGNRRIARVPNPNSFDNQINLPFNPASRPDVNFAALKAGTQTSEIDLDTWIGQDILNDLCDGQFNPRTCLIEHPVVRYDQMHGRFLVAFAVIDTGVRGNDIIVTQPRKASWVLLISRFATFTNPAPGGGVSNTLVFSTPIQDTTGGVEDANWFIYYGDDGNGFLDINRYSTHPAVDPAVAPGAYPGGAFPDSDCTIAAVPAAGIDPLAPYTPGPVCYFPTEVRIGIDNDSVILVSPVVDVNRTLLNSNTVLGTTGPFAGNRVRVLSKRNGVYAFKALTNCFVGNAACDGDAVNPLTPILFSGPAVGTLPPPAPKATQWDLFRITPTTYPGPPARYTIGLEYVNNGATSSVPDNHYYMEPVHLRGRTLASYSNYPFAGQTVLIGGPGPSTFTTLPNSLFVQQIGYRSDYVPLLTGPGALQHFVTDNALAPGAVRQNLACSTTPCQQTPPNPQRDFDLYVGDARPQKAIFREGHIYDARVGRDFFNNPSSGPNLPNLGLLSTVFYDVIQARPGTPIPTFARSDFRLVSIVVAGNVATVTTSVPHGLVPNRLVTVSGATEDSDLNGTYAIVAVPTPTTFTFNTTDVAADTYNETTLIVITQPFIPPTNTGPAVPFAPSNVLYSKWQNGHFYAPMFDVPANVLQSGAVSPVNLLPYFDKLFVGTTSPRFGAPSPTVEGNIWPSLFDVRQGQDRFEQYVAFRNPHTGQYADPNIRFDAGGGALPPTPLTNVMTVRGGAATDPNFGGLWVYGTFAAFRLAGNIGEWGTNAAYYDMTFQSPDPYNTGTIAYADVPNNHVFFRYIQTVKNLGLDQFLDNPPSPQSAQHGQNNAQPNFLPDQTVRRREMAAFIINAQMDPAAIDHYLSITPGGLDTSSFADVPVGSPNWKAIELMFRRGYTRGCGLTNDGTLNFCPDDLTTRGQMAVFVVRAKMSNVFPTLFSGCPVPSSGVPTCSTGGDNFGLFLQTDPYFPGDTPATHPFFTYIQKLRELRITNGLTQANYGTSVDFSSDNDPNNLSTKLTRGQMATFIVRAFFF